jgi:hypothetical protein
MCVYTTISWPESSRHTATIFSMWYSPAVTIAAIAACSAQNPVPDPVSIQTPENSRPLPTTRVAPTSPNRRPPPTR